MRFPKNKYASTLEPLDWGFEVGPTGELMVNGCSTVRLAEEYGTPLHVINEDRLEKTASDFRKSVETRYPGEVSVHYAFKCNSVPAVVQTIRRAGLKAEVMSEFELDLAGRLGFMSEEIIVNGPCKTDDFLRHCVESKTRFTVADSIEELQSLGLITESMGREANVLLRINPDYS